MILTDWDEPLTECEFRWPDGATLEVNEAWGDNGFDVTWTYADGERDFNYFPECEDPTFGSLFAADGRGFDDAERVY